MYDSIGLWLPSEEIGTPNIKHLSSLLKNFAEIKKHEILSHSGMLGENIIVYLNQSGISLKGSISRYYNSHNFDSLSLSDTKRTIEKLSDELLLPVSKSKVTRLDVMPQNIITNYKPKNYYPYLSTSKYFKKIMHQESIEYRNHRKSKIIYDKIAQAKSNREKIPVQWSNKNVLRYELRFKNRLPKQFNMPEVKASTLYSEEFQILCLEKWHEEFKSINTLNIIKTNMNNIKTASDIMQFLAYEGLLSMGYENALRMIDTLKEKETMSNLEAYSRAKSKIKQLANNKDITEQSELITELESKVEAIRINYSL